MGLISRVSSRTYRYSSLMDSEQRVQALSIAIAQIVKNEGFENIDSKVLSNLTTIAERLLYHLSSKSQAMVEVNQRTVATFKDCYSALAVEGIEIDSVIDYLQSRYLSNRRDQIRMIQKDVQTVEPKRMKVGPRTHVPNPHSANVPEKPDLHTFKRIHCAIDHDENNFKKVRILASERKMINRGALTNF